MEPSKNILFGKNKKIRNRFFLLSLHRTKFLIFHPIKSFKYLCSKRTDYSRISIAEISELLGEAKNIIEAGAADGVDTAIFAKTFQKANIFAVEPVFEQFQYLEKKFSRTKNVILSNLAFSDTDGVGEMFVGQSTGGISGMGSSSLLNPTAHMKYFPEIEFPKKQKVDLVRLDSYLLAYKIDLVDLLWLDLQGKEVDVLAGSASALREKVRFLHLEISRIKFYDHMPTLVTVRRFLNANGFRCLIDRVGAISGNALYSNKKFE
jgi:FkbM family methyltransferase